MLPVVLSILRRARLGNGKAGARLPHSYQTNISITAAATGNSPQDVQVIVDIVPEPGLWFGVAAWPRPGRRLNRGLA